MKRLDCSDASDFDVTFRVMFTMWQACELWSLVSDQETANLPADAPVHETQTRQTRRSGSGDNGGYHPFIEGLLQTLPEPGTLWAMEGRAAWLRAAANNFTLMYQGEGQIFVEAKDGSEKVAAAPKKGAAA
jgi:hypothetical protein